jgi:hypothetical protein
MKRERRTFTRELKVEAVRLAEQWGTRAAAESLGLDISSPAPMEEAA